MSKQGYEQTGVAMTCRDYQEYVSMFGLTDELLRRGPILDVAAGGASFTAEANRLGYQAMAVDPRYDLAEVGAWIDEASGEIETSTAKLRKLQDSFDWSYYGSLEKHHARRVRSLKLFAADVAAADCRQRYAAGKLPMLPFGDHTFTTVLCSHFLFLYAEQFGLDFHEQAISELMRVCRAGGQIRIYPLLSLQWKRHPQLPELMAFIESRGGRAELLETGLPFIPGSDQMLRISL